jgi:hypothetical protein
MVADALQSIASLCGHWLSASIRHKLLAHGAVAAHAVAAQRQYPES